jgi:gluconate 2-dehydrogenase gamma chain
MLNESLGRRTLLRSSVLLIPGVAEALQHAHQAVALPVARIEYLSTADATEIESLAAEIIPRGEGSGPESGGAKEAGVIYFIDRALGTFDREKRTLYRDGLASAQTKRKQLFPTSISLAALTSPQRISILEAIDKTPFFDALREHTIIAFFAAPEWGGNRDKIGWKMIGFDDKWSFHPPFGFYDRPENL